MKRLVRTVPRLSDAVVDWVTRNSAKPTGVTLAHPQWLVTWLFGRALSRVAHLVQGNVLDVGCGNKPWREVFKNAKRYTGVDYLGPSATSEASQNVDVIANAEHLPFLSASFDTLLAMRVLEHVRRPEVAVAEFHRVLKPGGTIMLTTPFLYRVHNAEHDFHRWTANGLADLLQHHGLEGITVRPVGGPYVVVVTAICVRTHYEMSGWRSADTTAAKVRAFLWRCLVRPLLLPLYLVANGIGALVYWRTPLSPRDESMPITYVATARKGPEQQR